MATKTSKTISSDCGDDSLGMFYNDRLPSELIFSQLSGCQCTGPSCNPDQCDCVKRRNGSVFDSSFRLSCLLDYKNSQQLQPVFECNSCCACQPTCSNRLVQHFVGRFPALKVVNTGNADKGLGVICEKDLSPGQFVCVYMGEYILPSDAGRCHATPPPPEGEVANAIRKLRNNKAPGEDGIPAEIFKSCVDTLAPWLHGVIERAWRDEVVPDDWGLGILVPILKKGDKTRCENYRGISLVDVATKIFAIVLLRRFQAVHDSRTNPAKPDFVLDEDAQIRYLQ
nr:unnamed protein product [Spirometra erinaceieuropaei]